MSAGGGQAWAVFDDGLPVLTREYSFGPGTARSLAVGGREGLVVVSPPARPVEGDFAALARRGGVRALVASNAFHHLGLRDWKARFPDAALFAPAQSIARVEKQTGLTGIRPVAEVAALAAPGVEFVDMPNYRTGEVLVRVETARGHAWYVTDVIMNMPELPRHPVVRVLFGVTGSAPGLRYNRVAALFMVRDRRALRRWLADEAAKRPPRWLIPAHGDIVDLSTAGGRAPFAAR